MGIKLSRLVFWLIAAALLVFGLYYTFREQAYFVDVASVEVGSLQVSIAEEGETRVRDIFELSSPLMGRVLRLEVEAGDEVIAAETVVAKIEPNDPAFLDIRSEEEARAGVKASEALLMLAKAQLSEAESELEFAFSEMERTQRLVDRRLVSLRDLDQTKKNYKTKSASVETALASIKARESELAQAKARLVTPINIQGSSEKCKCLSLFSPTTGKILRVLHESEGIIEPGDVLVEIGNVSDLEIVVDFLSIDAVRIEPGQRVIIDHWGGDFFLNGIVQKVEPFGYTKVSSLGIEEQRVDVIINLVDSSDQWASLGHGYQVEARVILWQEENILKLPITSLFRKDLDWSVFVVEDGRAILKKIQLGKKNAFEAQVLSGLEEGELVILHPSNQVKNGVLVDKRKI
jgi:HlyD family secretion protein